MFVGSLSVRLSVPNCEHLIRNLGFILFSDLLFKAMRDQCHHAGV